MWISTAVRKFACDQQFESGYDGLLYLDFRNNWFGFRVTGARAGAHAQNERAYLATRTSGGG